MRVLFSTHGSCGNVEPMAALAVQLRTLGAEMRVYAAPDKQFDTAAAAEGCDALVTTGVMPAGVWL